MESTKKFTKKNRYRIAETCPCGKSNKDGKFVPFDGLKNKGYCFSCGETFRPEDTENFKPDNGHKYQEMKQPKYVNEDILNRSMSDYEKNTFYQYVESLVGAEAAREISELYKLGTTNKGEVIFWLIDKNQNIRQPKIMQYNQEGNKIGVPHVQSGYTRDNGYSPSLFGAHLLGDKSKLVYLTESEKSACLGSFEFPEYIWLASGGANGLTRDKAEILRGFKVIILYDADSQGRAGAEAAHLVLEKLGIQSNVKDLFPDRIDGYDIADKIRDYLKPQSECTPQEHLKYDFYFGPNGFLRDELDKGLLIAV